MDHTDAPAGPAGDPTAGIDPDPGVGADAAMDADVAVVGAGPAGVAAAVTLARAGRDVVLIDRATFPRDKCCGDGLTVAALRELEALGLRPASLPGWQVVRTIQMRGPAGHTVRLPLPDGRGVFAAVVPRQELDAALVDLARGAGVRVMEGRAMVAASIGPGAIVLDVEGTGKLTVPYAIGADGAWSPLRHALGAHEPGYLGDWHAFRQYFRNVGPAAADLWVWFEPDFLPGYAWSFPLPDGRANVGFGVSRTSGFEVRAMKELWPALLERPHVREVLGPDAEPEAPHRAWPIPARVNAVPLTAARGRALFAGDAACATDPLTGEGIAQALLTGRLAAEAVMAAGPDRPDLAAARYEVGVRRELFADHRMARVLSRGLSHRKGARVAIRLAGSTAWTRRQFGRWLFEDYPRALVLTPRRWRPRALRPPPAYAGEVGDVGVGPSASDTQGSSE